MSAVTNTLAPWETLPPLGQQRPLGQSWLSPKFLLPLGARPLHASRAAGDRGHSFNHSPLVPSSRLNSQLTLPSAVTPRMARQVAPSPSPRQPDPAAEMPPAGKRSRLQLQPQSPTILPTPEADRSSPSVARQAAAQDEPSPQTPPTIAAVPRSPTPAPNLPAPSPQPAPPTQAKTGIEVGRSPTATPNVSSASPQTGLSPSPHLTRVDATSPSGGDPAPASPAAVRPTIHPASASAAPPAPAHSASHSAPSPTLQAQQLPVGKQPSTPNPPAKISAPLPGQAEQAGQETLPPSPPSTVQPKAAARDASSAIAPPEETARPAAASTPPSEPAAVSSPSATPPRPAPPPSGQTTSPPSPPPDLTRGSRSPAASPKPPPAPRPSPNAASPPLQTQRTSPSSPVPTTSGPPPIVQTASPSPSRRSTAHHHQPTPTAVDGSASESPISAPKPQTPALVVSPKPAQQSSTTIQRKSQPGIADAARTHAETPLPPLAESRNADEIASPCSTDAEVGSAPSDASSFGGIQQVGRSHSPLSPPPTASLSAATSKPSVTSPPPPAANAERPKVQAQATSEQPPSSNRDNVPFPQPARTEAPTPQQTGSAQRASSSDSAAIAEPGQPPTAPAPPSNPAPVNRKTIIQAAAQPSVVQRSAPQPSTPQAASPNRIVRAESDTAISPQDAPVAPTSSPAAPALQAKSQPAILSPSPSRDATSVEASSPSPVAPNPTESKVDAPETTVPSVQTQRSLAPPSPAALPPQFPKKLSNPSALNQPPPSLVPPLEPARRSEGAVTSSPAAETIPTPPAAAPMPPVQTSPSSSTPPKISPNADMASAQLSSAVAPSPPAPPPTSQPPPPLQNDGSPWVAPAPQADGEMSLARSPTAPNPPSVPDTWNGIADLLNPSPPTPAASRDTTSPPPPAVQSASSAGAVVQRAIGDSLAELVNSVPSDAASAAATYPMVQPLREDNAASPATPITPDDPPGETIAAPSSKDDRENSMDLLDALAYEIYSLIKQRLEIERERQGNSYTGRLPW